MMSEMRPHIAKQFDKNFFLIITYNFRLSKYYISARVVSFLFKLCTYQHKYCPEQQNCMYSNKNYVHIKKTDVHINTNFVYMNTLYMHQHRLGHGSPVVTHLSSTSGVGGSNPGPYVGKLLVVYCWSEVYSTVP